MSSIITVGVRSATICCLLTSSFLLALGLHDFLSSRSVRGALGPNQMTISFGSSNVGSEFRVIHMLHNSSYKKVIVLGSNDSCIRRGCVAAEGLPLEVPARQTREVKIKTRVSMPGAIKGTLILYTDSPGQSEIFLTVVGRGS
jgi:hypothetical protein